MQRINYLEEEDACQNFLDDNIINSINRILFQCVTFKGDVCMYYVFVICDPLKSIRRTETDVKQRSSRVNANFISCTPM